MGHFHVRSAGLGRHAATSPRPTHGVRHRLPSQGLRVRGPGGRRDGMLLQAWGSRGEGHTRPPPGARRGHRGGGTESPGRQFTGTFVRTQIPRTVAEPCPVAGSFMKLGAAPSC